MPAGNAKMSTTDRKIIKSKGNLPIPNSDKASPNVFKFISFLIAMSIYPKLLNYTIFFAKIIVLFSMKLKLYLQTY